MKKFISLMICVAMILSSVVAMADSDSLIVNTVKVNVSSGSVTLNDEGMSVSAAPYVNQNGDTMVDMYALVNALGGEITEKDGVYSVTYDDVEIKYTLNSTEVDVAGQTLTMSSAVTISDTRNCNGTVEICFGGAWCRRNIQQRKRRNCNCFGRRSGFGSELQAVV